MPTYKVQYGGKTYRVQNDKELTPAQVEAELIGAGIIQPQFADSGQGYGSSMIGSAARGAGSIIPGVIGGAGYLLGSGTLKGAADEVESAIRDIAPVNPAYEQSFPIKASGAVGQAASLIPQAGVGGVLGKVIAGARGTKAGAQTAVLGGAFLSGTRGGGKEAERYGLENNAAYARALLGGATEVLTEKLPFGTALETAAARKLLGDVLEKGAGSVVKATATEAAEGALSQIGGNVATKVLAPEGIETPGVMEGTLEAAALEGIGGTTLGVINAAVSSPAPMTEKAVESTTGITPPKDEVAQVESPVDLEKLSQDLVGASEITPMIVSEGQVVAPASTQAFEEAMGEKPVEEAPPEATPPVVTELPSETQALPVEQPIPTPQAPVEVAQETVIEPPPQADVPPEIIPEPVAPVETPATATEVSESPRDQTSSTPEQVAYAVGDNVRYREEGQTLTGTVMGSDNLGRVVIVTPDGKTNRIRPGAIVRPTTQSTPSQGGQSERGGVEQVASEPVAPQGSSSGAAEETIPPGMEVSTAAMQALQQANESLTERARQAWTDEVLEKAARYFESGDTKALEGLNKTQRSRIEKARQTADASYRAQIEENDRAQRLRDAIEGRQRYPQLSDPEENIRVYLQQNAGEFKPRTDPTLSLPESIELPSEEGQGSINLTGGRGIHKRVGQQVIDEFRKAAPFAPAIHLITREQIRTSNAPHLKALRETLAKYGATDAHVEGWYGSPAGPAYLVPENISDMARAREVLIHEVVSHYGIDQFTTPEQRQNLANAIQRAAPQIAAKVERNYVGADLDLFNKEVIAAFVDAWAQADPANTPSSWQRIWEQIKLLFQGIIKKLGGDPAAFDDLDIYNFVTASQRRLTKGLTAKERRMRDRQLREDDDEATATYLSLNTSASQNPVEVSPVFAGDIPQKRRETTAAHSRIGRFPAAHKFLRTLNLTYPPSFEGDDMAKANAFVESFFREDGQPLDWLIDASRAITDMANRAENRKFAEGDLNYRQIQGVHAIISSNAWQISQNIYDNIRLAEEGKGGDSSLDALKLADLYDDLGNFHLQQEQIVANYAGSLLQASAMVKKYLSPRNITKSYTAPVIAAVQQGLGTEGQTKVTGAMTKARKDGMDKARKQVREVIRKARKATGFPVSVDISQSIADRMVSALMENADLTKGVEESFLRQLESEVSKSVKERIDAALETETDRASPSAIERVMRSLDHADLLEQALREAQGRLLNTEGLELTEEQRAAIEGLNIATGLAEREAFIQVTKDAAQKVMEDVRSGEGLDGSFRAMEEAIYLTASDLRATRTAVIQAVMEHMPQLSRKQAELIADAVGQVFDNEVQEATRKELAKLIKAPEISHRKPKPGFIEAVLRFNRLGAYQEEQFWNAVAGHLKGFPTYSEEFAAKLRMKAAKIDAMGGRGKGDGDQFVEPSEQRYAALNDLHREILQEQMAQATGRQAAAFWLNRIYPSVLKGSMLTGISTAEAVVFGNYFGRVFNGAAKMMQLNADAKARGIPASERQKFFTDWLVSIVPLFSGGKEAWEEAWRAFTTGRSRLTNAQFKEQDVQGFPVTEGFTLKEAKRLLDDRKYGKAATTAALSWTKFGGRMIAAMDTFTGYASYYQSLRMLGRYEALKSGKRGEEVELELRDWFSPDAEYQAQVEAQIQNEIARGDFVLAGTPAEQEAQINSRRRQLMGQVPPARLRKDSLDYQQYVSLNTSSQGVVGWFFEGILGNVMGKIPVIGPVFFSFMRPLANSINMAASFSPFGHETFRIIQPSRWQWLRNVVPAKWWTAGWPEMTQEQKDFANSQAIVGTMVLGALAAIITLEDYLGGDDDEDKFLRLYGPNPFLGDPDGFNKMEQLKRTGWRDSTLFIGDIGLRYADWPMFGFFLGLYGSKLDRDKAAKRKGVELTWGEQAWSGAFGATSSVVNKTLSQGVFNFMDLALSLRDNPSEFRRNVSKFGRQAVGSITNPRVTRDMRRFYDNIANGEDVPLETMGPERELNSYVPFYLGSQDPRISPLGKNWSNEPFLWMGDRFFALHGYQEQDKIAALAEARIFLPDVDLSTKLRVPGEAEKVTLRKAGSAAIDAFKKFRGEYFDRVLTPEAIRLVIERSQGKNADEAREILYDVLRVQRANDFARIRTWEALSAK